MRHFGVTVEIQAPPERVWSVMSDAERWPEWTPTVTRVERLGPGPFAVRSLWRIRQPKLPPAIWQITELDEGRAFTWVSRAPGVRVSARHGVEAYRGGSRATLSLEFSGLLGPFWGRLTRGLNERYLALEARCLKARSEGLKPSHRFDHQNTSTGGIR